MTRCVLWKCGGHTHLAALADHPPDGPRVRALCGKTADAIQLADLPTEGAVTCTACRTEEEIIALVKYLAA